jgi:hypothetical protein
LAALDSRFRGNDDKRMKVLTVRIGPPGMGHSVTATSMSFDHDSMSVKLSVRRTLEALLAWFPRLLREKQRNACRISRRGLYWEVLKRIFRLPACSPATVTKPARRLTPPNRHTIIL